MSVELVYQDQLLSTGRTIELVTSEVSVSIESVDLGVSVDLTVSRPMAVELAIVESLISVDLSMTNAIVAVDGVQLKNPDPTYSQDRRLVRVDYDGGLYKTYTYTSGLLTQVDFFDGSKTVRKTISFVDGVWAGTTEVIL